MDRRHDLALLGFFAATKCDQAQSSIAFIFPFTPSRGREISTKPPPDEPCGIQLIIRPGTERRTTVPLFNRPPVDIFVRKAERFPTFVGDILHYGVVTHIYTSFGEPPKTAIRLSLALPST